MLPPPTLSPADRREILELFLHNPELNRYRSLYLSYFGNAFWWIATRSRVHNQKWPLTMHERTHQISSHRHELWKCRHILLRKAATRMHHDEPFSYDTKYKERSLKTYCFPILIAGKRFGVIGITTRSAAWKQPLVGIIQHHLKVLTDKVTRDFEHRRLSESVRPRAIALSTVHTVHRLINSTLNLDELIQRLSRLTSQVLRAKTCAIFLFDPSKKKTRPLIERAKVGFPKRKLKLFRSLKPGEGVEGRVYTTAKSILRKNIISVPLIDEDVIGVITLTKKIDTKKFNMFDLEILTTLAEEAIVAIKNAQLYGEQKRVTLGAIQSMAAILETRYGHERQLSQQTLLKITLAIAGILKLPDEDVQAIHYATLLKDASKIGLPDEIMKKPSTLTGEEYQKLRQHPIKGATIMQSFESLKPVAPIILYAHEHFDGSGYPQGLKGKEIPMGARILAVVNAVDALIAGRPYRSKYSLKEAVQELRNHKGTQFDPKVVEAFERVIARRSIAKLLAGI